MSSHEHGTAHHTYTHLTIGSRVEIGGQSGTVTDFHETGVHVLLDGDEGTVVTATCTSATDKTLVPAVSLLPVEPKSAA